MAEIPPSEVALFSDLIGPDLIDIHSGRSGLILTVYAASIPRITTILRDHKRCYYAQLVDIICVDYPQNAQRFEIIYSLLSHRLNKRIFIKIHTDEQTPIPSISQIFAGAPWYEREVYDLFGVTFSDHPDMRRILTDYNFTGHPLRKDFPLTGYTQVYFDEEQHRVAYEPVKLQQKFRSFDFLSPWEAMFHDGDKPENKVEKQ